jgi:competence ComEA-like helix-hairpin-helix protein
MGWKKEVAAYFHFTGKDRLAILVLVILIIFVWVAPRWKQSVTRPRIVDNDTGWFATVRELERPESGNEKGNISDESEAHGGFERRVHQRSSRQQGALFYFDPNTASAGDWEKLGLRAKTARTILNFVDRGGRFREAEDLKKIYGLFPDEYERLAPYVRIQTTVHENPEKPTDNRYVKNPGMAKKQYQVVDINLADTSAFIALPGIGSKLAARIIAFREKLGGFYKVEQVAETFGLADSVYQKIKPYLAIENMQVKKINLNTATIDELKMHPYIRFQLAKPIIAFRDTHGSFKTVGDIKNIMGVTDAFFEKVVAYLTVE